jgi:hypothetical protein
MNNLLQTTAVVLGVARPRLSGRGSLKVGVVAKNLRALRAQLYLQPHHIKIPRSAPEHKCSLAEVYK